MKKYLYELINISIGARRFIISECVFGIGAGIFSLLLNLHLLALGINEKKIGEILSIGNLVVGIACIPTVLIANTLGRKFVLSVGAGLMGCGYFIFGFSKDINGFYLGQIILSIGITFVITSEIQLLYSYCHSKSEEIKSYNLIFATFTLFVGVGTLIGGFLPRIIPGKTTIYQGSLYVAALFLLTTCILRSLWLPQAPHIQKIPFKNEPDLSNKKSRVSHIFLFCIFAILSGLSNGWIISFLNIIVKFRLNWTDEKVSFLLSIHGFFLFAGSLLVPFLFNKFGISKSFAGIFLFNIILSLLLYMVLPNSLLILFLLCRGGTTIMLSNMIAGQSMSTIEDIDRNLFAGLWSISISIGISAATYFSGIILNDKNYNLSFLCAAIIITINFLYFIFWIRPILIKSKSDFDQGPKPSPWSTQSNSSGRSTSY